MKVMRKSILLALAVLMLPSLAWASGGGHGFDLKVHGFYLLNFILFVWLLVRFAGGSLKGAIEKRSDEFQARVSEAREQIDSARSKLDAADKKHRKAETDAVEIEKRLIEDGKVLHRKIVERGHEEAKKVKKSVELSLASEKKRMSNFVEQEIALAALNEAENMLFAKKAALPQDVFIRQFIDGLNETKEGAGS